MAQRKEVFQSKVFQKLYPAASPLRKDPSPLHVVESLANKTHVKRKAAEDATPDGKRPSAAIQGRRVYTVLPPPPDYDAHSQESVKQTSVEDPAEKSESDEDLDEESGEGEQTRRKRRRKRKRALRPDSGFEQPPLTTEHGAAQSQSPVEEGGERVSRNKKRKLKKKRHRQKLLSMGLMPRASALEFTHQKEGKEEEDVRADADEEEGKAAEVSDFLRKTMEMYSLDPSLHAAVAPRLSATVDDLLGSLASGGRHRSVLRQLYDLKVLVQRGEAGDTQKGLDGLRSSSVLSAEETAAVVSLFQYWITDILPMQGGEEETGLCTHP